MSADVSEAIAPSETNISNNDDTSLHESSSIGSVNPFLEQHDVEIAVDTSVDDTLMSNEGFYDLNKEVYTTPVHIEEPFIEKEENAFNAEIDQFDLFAAKFEESKSKRNSLTNVDGFSAREYGKFDNAWGDETKSSFINENNLGFDAEDNFGALDIQSDEEPQLNVVIKPISGSNIWQGDVSPLAPPAPTVQSTYTERGKTTNPLQFYFMIMTCLR